MCPVKLFFSKLWQIRGRLPVILCFDAFHQNGCLGAKSLLIDAKICIPLRPKGDASYSSQLEACPRIWTRARKFHSRLCQLSSPGWQRKRGEGHRTLPNLGMSQTLAATSLTTQHQGSAQKRWGGVYYLYRALDLEQKPHMIGAQRPGSELHQQTSSSWPSERSGQKYSHWKGGHLSNAHHHLYRSLAHAVHGISYALRQSLPVVVVWRWTEQPWALCIFSLCLVQQSLSRSVLQREGAPHILPGQPSALPKTSPCPSSELSELRSSSGSGWRMYIPFARTVHRMSLVEIWGSQISSCLNSRVTWTAV